MGQEPRQTTSNLGHLHRPSIQARIHGLNRHYYSMAINYRKNELEEQVRRLSERLSERLSDQPMEKHCVPLLHGSDCCGL